MYICNDCGSVFDKPEHRILINGIMHETEPICPNCKNDDFEVTEKHCPFSGGYIKESQDVSEGAKQAILADLIKVRDNYCHDSEQQAAFDVLTAEWLETL